MNHPAPTAPDPKKGKPQLPAEFDWDGALSDLAMIRGRMRGDSDAVVVVREGRAELERRPGRRD
jgi:hypothetical protein